MRTEEDIAHDIRRGCKVCTGCGTLTEFTGFHKQASSPDGLANYCMKCKKRSSRSNYLKHRYKMTEDNYHEMIEDQAGNCAICGSPDETISANLAVDHCHTSKAVRGLLCSNCNTGLGLLGDSIQILTGAIRYLDKFNTIK